MSIQAGDVAHVITLLFQPVRKRILPQKPRTGTGGQRSIQNLTVTPIRSIKADVDIRAAIPLLLTVIIQSKLIGPAVISLPRRISTLKQQICRSIVPHNKDQITLPALPLSRQTPHIYAADPVLRNHQLDTGLPATLTQTPRTRLRIRLHHALERPQLLHQPSTASPIKPHAENLNPKR